MPTSRGWTAIGVGAALFLLWLGFGETELLGFATFLTIAVIAGIAFVRWSSPAVQVGRRISPVQVHEGTHVVVEVGLEAEKRLRNVTVQDTVHGLGTAQFVAGRTTPDHPLVARYEVLCSRRGIFRVGPAVVSVVDPLGLTERRRVFGGQDLLTVYPRVEELGGFPVVRGHDPAVQSTRPTFSPSGGEDFFTLREYQLGDDLRRVHWPSSAKRDTLMIKQLEIPWQSRALVLIDQRQETYRDEDGFEQAVRGAASVVFHLYEGGFSPELWTTERAHAKRSGNRYTQAMDVLAGVQSKPGLDLRRTVSRLRRRGLGGGALVIVTGTPDEQSLAAFRALTKDFTRSIVMCVTDEGADVLTLFQRAGAVTVATSTGAPWSPAWRTAMELSWSTV